MKKNIGYLTVLLSAVAGYCDTVTFTVADNIFSAHVTGNFIVFAYQIMNSDNLNAQLRLLTLPIFMLSILTAGWIAKNSGNRRHELIYWEGLILTLTGVFAYMLKIVNMLSGQLTFILAMFFVIAMGFQNAFGKIYSSETFGPTTVMTGNVTQLSLELGYNYKHFFNNYKLSVRFIEQLITVTGFLIGCFMGAIAGKYFNLGAAILPGIVLMFYYFNNLNKKNKETIPQENKK